MATKRKTPPDPVPAPSRSAAATTDHVVRSLSRSRMERRTLYLIVGAVAGIWLFVVFANALADASAQNARLAAEQRVNATLEAQASAGAVEIATIQGQTFLDFLARSYGYGELAELSFALTPDAPPPPSMAPLGAGEVRTAATTPLEDWLDLLIGS